MGHKIQGLSHITERNYIHALKVFAIISIVSAHSSSVDMDTNQLNSIFSWLLDQIGGIGVGVFFIISGYLFYKNKHSPRNFFKRRINTIFIPWLVCGTAVYLYVVLRKGGVELTGWFNFLLGNGSYLYYLTLLIFFYVLFFFTSKNKTFVLGTIILSCLSIILTSLGLLESINPFLNPLNFICYFSVGLLIADKNSLLKVAYKCYDYKYLLLSLYVALLIVIGVFDITAGYWGYASLIMQPLAISLFFWIGYVEVYLQ